MWFFKYGLKWIFALPKEKNLFKARKTHFCVKVFWTSINFTPVKWFLKRTCIFTKRIMFYVKVLCSCFCACASYINVILYVQCTLVQCSCKCLYTSRKYWRTILILTNILRWVGDNAYSIKIWIFWIFV